MPASRKDCTDVAPCRFEKRRSEEHTSELQSLRHLVCRLLLAKKDHSVRFPETKKSANSPTSSTERRITSTTKPTSARALSSVQKTFEMAVSRNPPDPDLSHHR